MTITLPFLKTSADRRLDEQLALAAALVTAWLGSKEDA